MRDKHFLTGNFRLEMCILTGKVLAGKYGYASYVCRFWRANVYGGGKYDVTVTNHNCRLDACRRDGVNCRRDG